ncbi:MAG: hypothetical protein KJP12_08075 [Acidimicrobiia bacterium]|nr:hypothetical protein [Acidimicrobiia bacterium]NNF68503.1 hypothetical protein [Acidimicrobiia bacterium]
MRLNTSSLAAGVVFIIIGVVFLLAALDVWDIRPAYLWPGLLIGIGVVIAFGGRTVGSDNSSNGVIR